MKKELIGNMFYHIPSLELHHSFPNLQKESAIIYSNKNEQTLNFFKTFLVRNLM